MVLPLMYECESLVLVRLLHWVRVGPLIHEPPRRNCIFSPPCVHSHTLPPISKSPKGLVPLGKEPTGAVRPYPSLSPKMLARPLLKVCPPRVL